MAPTPVLSLLIAVGVVPVAVLPVLLLKPMAIRLLLALVPLMIISTITVIVPVGMIVGGHSSNRRKHGRSQNEGHK